MTPVHTLSTTDTFTARLLQAGKWVWLLMLTISFAQCGHAQTETYDIMTYTPPKGWKKEVKNSSIVYTKTNGKKNTFCLIGMYKSAQSKGSVEEDFNNDWQTFIAQPYQVTVPPTMTEVPDADGWKIKSGSAPFTFSGAQATALLTSMTKGNLTVCFITMANSPDYAQEVEDLFSSITLAGNGSSVTTDPGLANNTTDNTTPAPAAPSASGATTAKADGFKFTTTNFDDGWVSTVQEDWVEVSKDNVKVLIHYTQLKYEADDVKTLSTKAWNALVAPRYSSMSNFAINYNIGFEQSRLASANVTDKATGQSLFVGLFQRANSPWCEFICPDKETFEKTFGVPVNFDYYASNDQLQGLIKMAGYNRFAVSPADLTGEWTSNFSGMTQYVNAYTGLNAGATAHASSQVYTFAANGSYKWTISVASGVVGNLKFSGVKSNGQFNLPNNWELYCSDLEGKPRNYPIMFSCVKGARILWIDGQQFGKKP